MILSKILVTGGAGFIGSHTVDLLLAQNQEVIVLDNLSSGSLQNLNLSHPKLHFVQADILQFELVRDLVKQCDAVLHLAAISSVPQSILDPLRSFQVNTQGFLHLLMAIHESKKPVRLVYASSAAVYGDLDELPCKEEQRARAKPLSPYAWQKRHIEDYADLYANLHGIKSLGLRYFNVYGERQNPSSPYSGVISRFIAAYKNNQALTIFGDGEQSRDFIAIKDVARANWLALKSDYHGVLNIASGLPQTLLQLINYIELAGGIPAKREFKSARRGDIRISYGETQLAKHHLGFEYTIPLSEGIKLV